MVDVFVALLGISAVLTGLLRILGGFATEERLGRRWTLGGIVLGTLEVALGALLLLTREVHPGLLVPIAAAWGVVSGILLLAQGLRLRRLARTWRQASGTPPKVPMNIRARSGRDSWSSRSTELLIARSTT